MKGIMLISILVAMLGSGLTVEATKVTFDSEHICYIDGVKFFPVGIYNVPVYTPVDRVALAKELGFNTIHSYCGRYSDAEYQDLMNRAAAQGLYIMPEVRWTPTVGSNGLVLDFSQPYVDTRKSLIGQTVNLVSGYSNLLAYYGSDEPELHTDPAFDPAGWAQGVDYLRGLDPNHPTAVTNYFVHGIQSFGPAADIIAPDPYPEFFSSTNSRIGINIVADRVNAAVAVANSKDGVMVVLQGWPYPAEPTYDQLRCQAYMAIACGAKGIFQYAMQNDTFQLSDNLGLQEKHRRLNSELVKLSPIFLTSSSKSIGITFGNSTEIYSYTRNYDGAIYVSAANGLENELYPENHEGQAQTAVTMALSGAPFSPDWLWVIDEQRPVRVTNNAWSDSFDRYGVHIYTSSYSNATILDDAGNVQRCYSEGPASWMEASTFVNASGWGGWEDFTSSGTSILPMGVCDINRDGYDDVVLIRNSGEIKVFTMAGTAYNGLLTLGNPKASWGWPLSSQDTGMKPVGVGDINGDLFGDLVVVDTSGDIKVLVTNGTSIQSNFTIGNPKTTWGWGLGSQDNSYKPLGVADLNGDGFGDIFVINSNGLIRVLLTNGNAITGFHDLGSPYISLGWAFTSLDNTIKPMKIGDVNGDGHADIVTVHPDGSCKALITNGTTLTGEILEMGNPYSDNNYTSTQTAKTSLDMPYGWGWTSVDNTTPNGSVSINSGSNYTSGTSVTLSLSASAVGTGNYISEMRFNGNGMDWGNWEAYSTSRTWSVAPGDGLKIVYVQFKDAAGKTSLVCTDTILLDSTPPWGSVSINDGARDTTVTSVTVGLYAADAGSGVAEMRFSSDNISWTNWEAYSASKQWTLASGEGYRSVFAQFRDIAGNISPSFSDSILLIRGPGIVSDGTVFEDLLDGASLDPAKWAYSNKSSTAELAVTNGYMYWATHHDINETIDLYSSTPLDYGTRNEWAVEVRFRVAATFSVELSTSDLYRAVTLIRGMNADPWWNGSTNDFCVMLLGGYGDVPFSLGWDWWNGGGTIVPLASNISLARDTWHRLVMHHKADHNIDFYLNDEYLTTRPAMTSQPAYRLYTGDNTGMTGGIVYFDYIRVGSPLGPPTLATITGNVVLNDFSGSSEDVLLKLELIQNGAAVHTERVRLQSDGSFSVPDIYPGTYDIGVKATNWLRSVMPGVNVSGTTSIGTVSLTNGDADGDDAATTTDISILLSNQGQTGN